MDKTPRLKWYAARLIAERSYVLKFLELEGVETARISDLPTLLFIHCSRHQVLKLKYELYSRAMFYRKGGDREPEAVKEKDMRSFLIMAPFHNKPIEYIAVDDPAFFVGQRLRVTEGEFKGCVGVRKRLKGDKRLVIRVSDTAAVITPFIPMRHLEPVEE